jgi:hypothetical protein
VVGLPLAEPGYHVVEIESLRLGQALLDKRAPMYVRTGVLVTNLGVHFKLGRENSVVWVTTLDRGKPVEGAEVAVNDCRGKPLWTGRSDAKGLAVVARALDAGLDDCPADAGYFVTARKADDGRRQERRRDRRRLRLQQLAEGHRAVALHVPTGRGAEPDLRAATVFDRTLFRAGETVSMKHFIRTETATGLAAVPTAKLPTKVKLVHQGSGQEFVFPLQWSGGGRSAATTWNIPPRPSSASTRSRSSGPSRPMPRRRPAGEGEGEGDARQRSWTSGNFRVEEFRLPLVDAAPRRAEGGAGGAGERRRRRADELLLRRADGRRAAARLGAAEDAQPGLRRLRRVLVRAAARSEEGRAGGSENDESDAPRRATASSSPTSCR